MTARRETRVVDFALANGWSAFLTRNNHYRFEKPGRKAVFFSSTTGDHRAILNGIAKLKRADKEASR